MSAVVVQPSRILVIARPPLARRTIDALAPEGYELHHSPCHCVAVLRWPFAPNLAVISLEMPWLEPLALAAELGSSACPMPVLLLTGADTRDLGGWPRIPADADPAQLRRAVADLLNRAASGGRRLPPDAAVG